jgi:integrase
MTFHFEFTVTADSAVARMPEPLQPAAALTPPPDATAGRLATVREVIDTRLWQLENAVKAGASADAFDNTRRNLQRFKRLFGDKPVAECRGFDLTTFLGANPQWRSGHSVKGALGAVMQAFEWAADEGLIAVNPYKKLPRAARLLECEPRRTAATREYVLLMRGARSRPLRRALFFLRRTGIRTKELRELVWTQVDFDRVDELGRPAPCLVFVRHKTRRQQKRPRPRLVGLEPCALRFLRNLHRRRKAGEDHVFLNCEGGVWDRHTFARHFRRWADRVGVASDLSAYCIRHHHTTEGLKTGVVSNREAADQLGHTTTAMVDRVYGHQAEDPAYMGQVAQKMVKRKRAPKKAAKPKGDGGLPLFGLE